MGSAKNLFRQAKLKALRALLAVSSLSLLALLGAVMGAGLSACTDNPKVKRAGVAEPAPTSTAPARERQGQPQETQEPDRSIPGSTDRSTPAPTSTASAEATPVGSPSPVPTAATPPGGSVGPGNMASGGGAVAAALDVPTALPSAVQEAQALKQACEQGQAPACLRAAAYETSKGKRDEAKKLYMLACVKEGVVTPASCKPSVPPSPATSDARGCYEAALMLLLDGDKASAKSALQCACDLSFTLACKDAKSL